MTLETVSRFFLWCAIINYSVIMVWFLVYVFCRAWMFRFHSLWFKLSEAEFQHLHYEGIMIYKIAVLVFCFVPYLVTLIL